MRAQLRKDLILDEGLKLKAYKCTAGKTTIGVGRNLDDLGITETEALSLLDHDLDRIDAELDKAIPWWRTKPENIQRALANMAFNMGWPRLSGFKNMLAALEAGRYDEAATHALDSQWAKQVGDRAKRVADLLKAA